mgnify:FL=1
MVRIIKHLCKYWYSVLIVIALLFVQAACDLSLPEYTSRIVNTGIQEGGIEDNTPEAITKESFEDILLFLNERDSKFVQNQYEVVSKKDATEEQLESYPTVEKQDIYVLKDISKENHEKLNQLLQKPLTYLLLFSGDTEEGAKIEQQIISKLPEQLSSIPDLTVMKLLEMMPKEQRQEMMKQLNQKMKDMPDTMLEQSAIQFVKTEYQRLGMDTDRIQTNYIFVSGLKMLGLALISMFATVMVGFLGSRIAARLARDLRNQVFKKVVDFSESEMKQFSTASLITRSTNDIQQVQMLLVFLLRTIFYAPIIAIGGVVKVLATGTGMAWIIAVAVMAIATLVIILFAIAMPKFKRVQKLIDRLNLVTREILTGLPVIRAFAKEKHEEARFDKANKDLKNNQLFIVRVMATMMPLMMFTMNAIAVLIVWEAAKGIDSGVMQVGDMMAFIQYTMQIIMSFLMISIVSIMLPRAIVSIGRIDEVLKTPFTILNPKQKKETTEVGTVEFKDVSFRYPDSDGYMLHHINFKANKGETVAFIGSTGSGKSTLINLIPRFFEATKGEVLVDGVNVKDLDQKDLRDKIGYVPQTGVLFSGTIASNLRYGKEDASDKEIQEALDIAQASEFVSKLPKGTENPISQGGTNVSGGQKQRLSIARAVIKKPEIYIFDDSFSALDFKTDAALRKALREKTKGSTMLIVAQRISTIMNADKIVVLDDGNVVGTGTHQELLKSCDVYREIALSQLSKEELDYEG